MSDDLPSDSEGRGVLRKQIILQRAKIRKEEKKSFSLGLLLIIVVSCLLVYLTFDIRFAIKVSTITVIVESGALILIIILLIQFDSLRREILSIFPSVEEQESIMNPSRKRPYYDLKFLSKVYDVNKNTLDKLFGKLKTFSGTWLAVSGGLASAFVVEIFKLQIVDYYSAFALIIIPVFSARVRQTSFSTENSRCVTSSFQ